MTKPEDREVPAPWGRLPVYAVGGLFQVGYAAGTDLLLVLSSQGRGVFDCLSGEKLVRDGSEAHDFFDPIRLTAIGIGPLDGQSVPVAGLFGGAYGFSETGRSFVIATSCDLTMFARPA